MARPGRSLLLLALSLLVATAAEARSYRWVDDKGVTHYGETVPPEYANRNVTELDERGRVVKTQEALTPEQQQARQDAVARQRAEEQARLDQRRRDNALLKTYSSGAEIDRARDRSLKQAEAQAENLRAQLADAAHASRAEALQQELARKEQEIAAIRARFEAEKQRYRELTGKP